MRKVFAFTFVLSALGVVLNFSSGVFSARALGAEGRGALAIVQVFPSVASWIFGFGAQQTLSYFFARFPHRRSSLLSSWIVLMIPCVVLSLVAQFLLLTTVIGDQTESVVHYARLWSFSVAISMWGAVINGALLGLHRYRTFALLNFIPAVFSGIGYPLLDWAGQLDLKRSLLLLIAGYISSFVVGAVTLLKAVSLGRPSFRQAKDSIWYGTKAHSSNFSQAINGRLDLALMPSLTSAVTVGHYLVATNVSWIIVQVGGALAPLVTPAALRTETFDARSLRSAIKATTFVGLGLAVVVAFVSALLIPTIYGSDFQASIVATEILLPGAVMFATSQVLWSGLYAMGRPFAAFWVQIPGLVCTGVGLVLFLKPFGLLAASITSTVSYGCVLIASLYALHRYSRITGNTTELEDVLVLKTEEQIGVDR